MVAHQSASPSSPPFFLVMPCLLLLLPLSILGFCTLASVYLWLPRTLFLCCCALIFSLINRNDIISDYAFVDVFEVMLRDIGGLICKILSDGRGEHSPLPSLHYCCITPNCCSSFQLHPHFLYSIQLWLILSPLSFQENSDLLIFHFLDDNDLRGTKKRRRRRRKRNGKRRR